MDLFSLALAVVLSDWARRLARRPGAPTFMKHIPYLLGTLWLAETSGVVVTLLLFKRAFRAVAAAGPADKERQFAAAIAAAMNPTVLGMVAFYVPAVVTAALLAWWSRRSSSASRTLGPRRTP